MYLLESFCTKGTGVYEFRLTSHGDILTYLPRIPLYAIPLLGVSSPPHLYPTDPSNAGRALLASPFLPPTGAGTDRRSCHRPAQGPTSVGTALHSDHRTSVGTDLRVCPPGRSGKEMAATPDRLRGVRRFGVEALFSAEGRRTDTEVGPYDCRPWIYLAIRRRMQWTAAAPSRYYPAAGCLPREGVQWPHHG
jgi:hypothetical protein